MMYEVARPIFFPQFPVGSYQQESCNTDEAAQKGEQKIKLPHPTTTTTASCLSLVTHTRPSARRDHTDSIIDSAVGVCKVPASLPLPSFFRHHLYLISFKIDCN